MKIMSVENYCKNKDLSYEEEVDTSFYGFFVGYIGIKSSLLFLKLYDDLKTAMIDKDGQGYLFDYNEDLFIKIIDKKNLIDYIQSALSPVIYYSDAWVDQRDQLLTTLIINRFKDILEELPNRTGIILNLNYDHNYAIFMDSKCKDEKYKEYEKILSDKLTKHPMLIDIKIISSDPSSNHYVQRLINDNTNIELQWTEIRQVPPNEIGNLLNLPRFDIDKTITKQLSLSLLRKKTVPPSTTLLDLDDWLEIPVSTKILEYFYNSFRIKREEGIILGKLMNGAEYKVRLDKDLPMFIYTASRVGSDIIKHIVHNTSNVIVLDTSDELAKELAKETELTFLQPPLFSLNPLVKENAVLEGICKILNIEDDCLRDKFYELVKSLPTPTLNKIYKLLYDAIYYDYIPYTSEKWVNAICNFRRLPEELSLNLLQVLEEILEVKDIRLSLGEDTISPNFLKNGAIISIPSSKYGHKLSEIVLSLLLLRLWYELKDEDVLFIVNAYSDHLPVVNYLISQGFKRIILVTKKTTTSADKRKSIFKTLLYDFKRRNVVFIKGYNTLVKIHKANYPIIRKKIIVDETFAPKTVNETDTIDSPKDIQIRMNIKLYKMLIGSSEFISIDELIQGLKQIPPDIRMLDLLTIEETIDFLENLRVELRKIHRSEIGFKLTVVAYMYYVKQRYFDVRPAIQRPNTIRPDLEIPSVSIVVEIEAENVFKAIEQVKWNMIKWTNIPHINEVHVWVTVDALETVLRIYASLPGSVKRKIKIFTVDFEEKKIYKPEEINEALEAIKRKRIEKEISEVFKDIKTNEKSRKQLKEKRDKKIRRVEENDKIKTIFDFPKKLEAEVVKICDETIVEEEITDSSGKHYKIVLSKDKSDALKQKIAELEQKGAYYFIRVNKEKKIVRILDKNGNVIRSIIVDDIKEL